MYVTTIGEDSLVRCSACDYSANLEVARFDRGDAPDEALKPIETSPHAGLEDDRAARARSSDVGPERTGKIIFFMGTFPGGDDDEGSERLVVAIVRGDMDANPIQVQRLAGALALRPAHDEEIEAVGAVAGFASPIGIDRSDALVIVDELVAVSPNLILGANEPDYHLLNTSCGRDYEADVVGEIATAFEGAPCPESPQSPSR